MVTLERRRRARILYMNTCDQAQVWTTSHCQDQDHPRLTVQNLTFVDGNATGETTEGGGGGAIFVRGGRLKVVNSRFFNNLCDATGPDVGGGAIRVFGQYAGPAGLRRRTAPSAARNGQRQRRARNGGGAQQHRRVVDGDQQPVLAQPRHRQRRQPGPGAARPGGGSGGAIYNDGNTSRSAVRHR